MSEYRYGDLIWADLDPAVGHEQRKRRPLIVVTNDQYNRFNNLVMVVPVTSAREYPLHIDIGTIADEQGGSIHGFAEIEQAKCLDLTARHAKKVGDVPETVMDAITDLLLGGLLQPGMRIEHIY